jgi:hypothetical protein
MPLFDASKICSRDLSLQEISAANIGIDRLRARQVSEIEVSILPDALLGSAVQVFFQGHVRRALMFIEGGYEAYLAGRGLVACTCARAIYETLACVLDFCDKLTGYLAEGDFEKTARFVFSRSFATRLKDFIHDELDNTAINVITQIDKVSRHLLPGLREEYDFLSEMTHPNGLGALEHFWETGDDIIKFSNGTDRDHFIIRTLIGAGRLLSLMDHGMSVMEAKLAQQPRFHLPSSLSRYQEKFETANAGCQFLMKNIAGNLVKCFVSREWLVKFDGTQPDRGCSRAELERLFRRNRLAIEAFAGAMYDRGLCGHGEHDVVVSWISM